MRIVQVIKGAMQAGRCRYCIGWVRCCHKCRAGVRGGRADGEGNCDCYRRYGSIQSFNSGVVGQAKNPIIQRAGLGKDLNEIAAEMRTDLAPRF